jgi:hypothetical protein
MLLTAPISISSGGTVVLSVYNGIRLGIIPGSSTTATYSKVDSETATAHDNATSATATVHTAIDIEWPYYMVTSSGGTTRVALI